MVEDLVFLCYSAVDTIDDSANVKVTVDTRLKFNQSLAGVFPKQISLRFRETGYKTTTYCLREK